MTTATLTADVMRRLEWSARVTGESLDDLAARWLANTARLAEIEAKRAEAARRKAKKARRAEWSEAL